ncbi:hypothetical protein SAMN05444161_5378 [Rhizobiales bacterium GAS191]|jgi:hypothetical protein|nr:hypothetical protein SAMN05519104_5644 [Rhizobiales bacterium GAS188]SEE30450.1 hypothetical protein SAMN05444161_5378 [Rhizobiales bacterium GAS191]
MKIRLFLPTVASLALFAALPVSANGLATAGSNQRLVQSAIGEQLAAAPSTPAEWEMYCRTIRNRPHRQACFATHGVKRRM